MKKFPKLLLLIPLLFFKSLGFGQICSKEQLPVNLQQGLVAYYPFCGNTNDESGFGNHIQNFGAILVNDQLGNTNAAYRFDGLSTYMQIPYASSYEALTDNFTFSFWIKNNKISPHDAMHVIHRNDGCFTLGIGGNSELGFARQGEAGLLVSDSTLKNEWTHVLFTMNGLTKSLYLNGVLNKSVVTEVGVINLIGAGMNIGIASPGGNGGAYRLEADISQLMWYNRVLSAEEVSSLYNSLGGLENKCETFSQINLLSDTTTLYGLTPKLSVAEGYANYLWNTGDTSSSIDATRTGLYTVAVQTQEGCTLTDSTYLLLNDLEIIATDTLLCGPSSITLSVSVDKGSFKYVGSFGESDYYIDTISRSWPQAREAARAQGMDLWVIESQVENDSVYNRLPYAENVLVNYWIGLYQDRDSPDYSEPFGGWKWVNGTSLSYSNWLGGEPNNQSGFSPFYEDYGIMWTTPYHGKWNDFYLQISNPAFYESGKTLAIAERSRKKYIWSTGDTTTSIAVTPLVNTDYVLTVEDNGIIFSDTIAIKAYPKVEFNPLPDTLAICGDSAILDAGSGYQSYIWNTGDTIAKINAEYSGTYKVAAINVDGCISYDSTLVSILKVHISNSDATICLGDSIRLSVTGLSSHNPILDNFLLAHYTLNGNILDAKGNFNGGSSNAVFVKDRFGIDSNAIQFNGVSTKASIGQSDNLTKLPLSISFWSKIPENGGGQVFSLAMGETFVNTWAIYMNDTTIQARYTPFNQSNISLLEGATSFKFNPGSWYHILVSFDSTSGLMIFIDGNQILNTEWKESPKEVNANYALNIGFYPATLPGGGYRFFKGELDDIKIYRKALSAEQIREIIYGSYSYIWSNGEVSPTIIVKPEMTTLYTVRSTNGINECTDQVTITVNAVDTSLTALDSTAICSGGSTRLQAGSGSNYVWLKNGSVIDGAVSSLYNASSAGSYRVIVTNATGCSDTSRSINVTMKNNPIAGNWNSLIPVCSGDNSTNLTISNSIGQLVWQSSTNGTNYYDIPNLTDSSYQAINLASTSYYRVIAINSCGSDTSAIQTITVNAAPQVSFSVNDSIQGLGGNLFVFTNTTSIGQGNTYLWDLGNDFYTSTRDVTFIYPLEGKYNVKLTVFTPENCEASFIQSVQVVDLPESGLINGSASVCGSINSNVLSVSGSSGTLQWQQSLNNLAFININGANETSYTASNLLATTYYRVIATKNGLYDTSAITAITVNPKPVPSFTVNTASQVLTNNSFVFTNTSTGGSSYLWRFGNGATATTQNATYSYSSAGSYVVRLIVTTAAGCKDSTSTTVTVTPPPPPPPPAAGNLYDAGATCATFNNGSASSLTQICYTVKAGRARRGRPAPIQVSAVTPASFMYYVKVIAPSASFTVNIGQTVSQKGFKLFTVNTKGSQASGDNCVRVASVTTPSTGQARVSITRATVGRTYIIGVRYDTKSLVGYTTTGAISPVYTFSAKIGNLTLPNSTSSVTAYPNNCANAPAGIISSRMPDSKEINSTTIAPTKALSITNLKLKAYPNPTSNYFNVLVEGGDRNMDGTIRVTNTLGQLIEERKQVRPGELIQVGHQYINGMYLIEYTQGTNRAVLKVNKH